MVAMPADNDAENFDFESERGDNPYLSERGRRVVKPAPDNSFGVRSLSARPSPQFAGFEIVERGSMQTDSDLMGGLGSSDLMHS
jgi:hypothetical protein